MGAYLDKPVTEKSVFSGKGTDFSYTMASMQGWRIEMEDAHDVQMSLAHSDYPQISNWSFFAIFDGHAGDKVANLSAEKLLSTLLATDKFKEVLALINEEGIVSIHPSTNEKIHVWLKEGFMELDAAMRPNIDDRSGTTAVCAILTPKHIFFANVGDSRSILSTETRIRFSTVDHKPELEGERERIEKAGGTVLLNRVNGTLAVSRALGDYDFKAHENLAVEEQLVIAQPTVDIVKRNPKEDAFLVLACDGIFEGLKEDQNETLCEMIRAKMKSSEPEAVVPEILDYCLEEGSHDNMTLILVKFDSGDKPSEEKSELKQRVLVIQKKEEAQVVQKKEET